MNDSDHEQQFTGRRRRRIIVEYRLSTPIPADQPALPFDPPQPADQDLTIAEKFERFHHANPHVYEALRNLALAEVKRGARIVRTKNLFEQLRSHGCSTVTAPDETYRLNNIFTSRYARLLSAEPELVGRIPQRKLVSE